MLNENQHLLAVFDTKNETLGSFTLSLENVQSYTVTFHVKSITGAGFPTSTVQLSVKGVMPAISYADIASSLSSVDFEDDPVPADGTETFLLNDNTDAVFNPELDALSSDGVAFSDSGFGYKSITATITNNSAATTDQFVVYAILHTTKAPN